MKDLSIVSPDHQRVTFVELFFDLVFVFCITQIAGLLHGRFELASTRDATLVFWLVWWAWTQFAWALNAANTDHPRVQAMTLAATGVAFFLAVGIPDAIGASAARFAVPYMVLRAIGLGLYNWVARADPAQRRAVQLFSLLSISGLAAVAIGTWIGGGAQYWWWGVAIALDLVAAGVGGRQEGWNLHADHFVERHGLIVIIALGETLIVAAAGLTEAPKTATTVATSALAVAVTSGLWWSYFRHARVAFEHALSGREGHARSRLARDVFSVLHFPMLCGVIAMAAATGEALAHPDATLPLPVRVAFAAGAVLFVCGTAAALWRATGRHLVGRLVLTPAFALVIVAVAGAPWVTLAFLLLLLLTISVIERRDPV